MAVRFIAASPSGRASRSGGPGCSNYELGLSKISWHRVKEIESLGYFPVGSGQTVGAETTPRPKRRSPCL